MSSPSRIPCVIARLVASAALAGLAGASGIALAERDGSAEALGIIKPTWRPGSYYESNDPGRPRSLQQPTPAQPGQGRGTAPGYAPDTGGAIAPRGADGRTVPPPPR